MQNAMLDLNEKLYVCFALARNSSVFCIISQTELLLLSIVSKVKAWFGLSCGRFFVMFYVLRQNSQPLVHTEWVKPNVTSA